MTRASSDLKTISMSTSGLTIAADAASSGRAGDDRGISEAALCQCRRHNERGGLSASEYGRDGALRPCPQRAGTAGGRDPRLPGGLLQPAGQRDRQADQNGEHVLHTLVLHELAAEKCADKSQTGAVMAKNIWDWNYDYDNEHIKVSRCSL